MCNKWYKSVEGGGAFVALQTNLSEASDWFSLELLIAELDGY